MSPPGGSKRDRVAGGEAPPASVAQTTPPVGMGHPEYHFVQGLMEAQKSLGEIKSAIDLLRADVSSVKTKVDDLIAWKNRIVGGAICLGVLFGILGWLGASIRDNVQIKLPGMIVPQQPVAAPPPAAAPATSPAPAATKAVP